MPGRRKGSGVPATSGYQEWAAYLERWSEGGQVDPSALGPLDQEAFAGDTWRRLTDRFTGALSRRLELWQASLGRSTSAAADEFEYGRALQQSRTGLRAIRTLAADERLPEELRTGLTGIVDGAVTSMQEQLEKRVDRLRGTGDANRRAEARLRTLRENPLTAVIGGTVVENPAAVPPPASAATDPFDTPRRRIARP
ncbi:hypothetical protein [Actinospica sp.]|uniref:hypothetical protein n=1 Tax=Actinospica sp. TaxID=1872142 RepID=UPI002BED3A92|nr:hypothetical protein [Actinospica sp.]HWG28498.1 hypothetical protein [Actinospica sp.]